MKQKNIPLILGLALTALLLIIVAIGAVWTPYDPTAMNAATISQSPSFAHFMGTDNFGRDIFSRVLQGAGTTVGIALVTVAIGGAVGTTLGALTGYFGGWVDTACMRVVDTITAFPSVLLALVLMGILGSGTANVTLSLGLVFIPSFTRVTRATFAQLRQKNFILSAKLMGISTPRIVFTHLLPNIWSVLLPCVTIGFNNAVLAEASMSYLGIGVTPPAASLGYMLSEGQGMLATTPWYALCTGGTLVALMFAVGLLGEGLQRKEGAV